MVISNLIYFSFIPIIAWLIMYVLIETKEKAFHRYTLKKASYYIWGAIIATMIVIVIIVVSLLI